MNLLSIPSTFIHNTAATTYNIIQSENIFCNVFKKLFLKNETQNYIKKTCLTSKNNVKSYVNISMIKIQ
jgi:phage FluMu protein Com